MKSDESRDDLKARLRELPANERDELLREIEDEPRDGYPSLKWATNPVTVKAALNFIASDETTTFEELRQHLNTLDECDIDPGNYSFGIVDTSDESMIFQTTGGRDAETEISLTQTGENIAAMFDDNHGVRPCERPLFFGLQPYGTGITFLSELDKHRDGNGVLRQDLEAALQVRYGDQGAHALGYFSAWYSSLGLIEREPDPDDGRRKRYFPSFSERH